MTILRRALFMLIPMAITSNNDTSIDVELLNNLAHKFNDYVASLRNGIVDLNKRKEVVRAWQKIKWE